MAIASSTLRTRLLATLAASAVGIFVLAGASAAEGDYQYQQGGLYNDHFTYPYPAAPQEQQSYNDSAPDDSASDDSGYGQSYSDGGQGDADADSDSDADTPDGMSDADDTAMNEEQIEVIAPRLRVERGSMLQPPGKISMSHVVAFNDLDLRTRGGARELKARIRDSATDICEQLSQFEPASYHDVGPCYREAVAGAMRRANAAIADARE